MPLGTGFEELVLCFLLFSGGKLFSAACYSSVLGGGVKEVFPVFSGFSRFCPVSLLLIKVTSPILCGFWRWVPQYL